MPFPVSIHPRSQGQLISYFYSPRFASVQFRTINSIYAPEFHMQHRCFEYVFCFAQPAFQILLLSTCV